MMTAALVLAPGTVGMIEASTTRKPAMPRTAQARIDDGIIRDAHRARTDGMLSDTHVVAQVGVEGGVTLQRRARFDFGGDESGERRCREQLACRVDAASRARRNRFGWRAGSALIFGRSNGSADRSSSRPRLSGCS